ncbi:metallophosphoesterase [Roseibium alexandrii]|uniref:metallophosphoesterase n=1 Tax=Roseibium alexandrii TaxID=388408 RepID=UPI003751C5E9
MRDIWFISDTHFGHENIIRHAQRPFDSTRETDEAIADNWTSCVKQCDLVYHLGDVAWTNAGLELFAKLPGTKRLILGNHDNGLRCVPLVQRLQLFRRFKAFGFMASHMPIRDEGLREPVNVHGHIHDNDPPTRNHVNVCVEKTDYRPVHLDVIRKIVRERREP